MSHPRAVGHQRLGFEKSVATVTQNKSTSFGMAGFAGYLHMARGNFREYLQGDVVWVKKYFYVLRPVLAMKWIEEGRGIVPTDFTVTVDKLPLASELKEAIAKLLESKRAGNELDRGAKIPAISEFIECELARWENSKIPRSVVPSTGDRLDEFFRESIKEVWQ